MHCTVDTTTIEFFAKDLEKWQPHGGINSADDILEYYSVLVCNMRPMVVRMDEK